MAKNKVYKNFIKFYDSFSIILFILLSVCVVLQVFFRYVARVPVAWTEELARFCMVAVTFLGAGTVSRRGDHLGSYFIKDKVQGRPKAVMMIIIKVVVLGFLMVMIKGGIEMYGLTWNNYAVTMPGLSNGILYISLLIGTVLMIIYTIRDLICSFKLLITGDTSNLKDGKSSPFGEED
ncbi:MAG: TRAP transporter small permease [Acetivibrionales bacterium]